MSARERDAARQRMPAWRVALERKLELLPDAPGVYLMKDRRGRILYVGKARRLPPRVRSYFRGAGSGDPRIEKLRGLIRDLEYVVTASETEALLLEASLVRTHAPRFNIDLKDDKSYPYLKLSVAHPFPRLEVTRRLVADGSRYFGPFVHAKDLRKVLRSLRQVFPLRSCSDARLKRGGRECLYYFIDLCRAPCTRRIEEREYRRLVEDLTAFLEGRGASLLRAWRAEMARAAEALRFEDASRLRDDIARLDSLMEAQRVVDPERPDLDAIALATRAGRAAVAVFSHRGGVVVGAWRIAVQRARLATPEEILEAAIARHYQERRAVPALLLVSDPPRNRELIEGWLSERAAARVRIAVARRGPRAKLLLAARENARLWLEELELVARGRHGRAAASVADLQAALELPQAPRRIEGYDVSTLQGGHAVASQVTFVNGQPHKGGYRRYRIRTVEGADDFAMLAEALARRFDRLRAEGGEAPDLVLVDGGSGQVARAARVLADRGFGALPLVGLAKREELLFPRGASRGLRLARSSPGLQLLQRVRDEAHRFAIGYHRRLRGRFLEEGPLAGIPGLGPRRRQAILDHFGGYGGLRAASAEEIGRVPGIGRDLAARVAAALAGTGEGEA